MGMRRQIAREAARLRHREAKQLFERALQAGREQWVLWCATINEMPWYRRVPIAWRVTWGILR